MAYSAGFSPHPKISYMGASPTGVASEAEYLEIGVARAVDPGELRAALDAALPEGLDVLEVVVAAGGNLAERIEASHWHIELAGVDTATAQAALAAVLESSQLEVERLTKTGRRTVDVRSAIVSGHVVGATGGQDHHPRAILEVVVRQATPAVRPDDVLAAMRLAAGLALTEPPLAVRVAQGPLDDSGAVGDPLVTDRAHVSPSP